MTKFNDFNLPEFLLKKLEAIGYETPTEIQEKSIQEILDGKDILASSQTGSGKTGAFSLPIIAKITESPLDTYALIVAPTRELVIQIKDMIKQMSGEGSIKTAVIFGGSDIRRQMDMLRRKPNIVIATPGRLQDHVNRGTINLSKFNILVLDEFDRMLDMGFRDDIAKIISEMPTERQTLMFSATTRKSIAEYTKAYLKDPVKITITPAKNTHDNITQDFIKVERKDKLTVLKKELAEREGSVLIFVNTKACADSLVMSLNDDEPSADVIHGDLRQRQRERTIKRFRDKKFRILIATDVVARGIDIPHIMHVINYDVPCSFEDYTHRIGRTGRCGVEGFSVCFVTPADRKVHNNILLQLDSDEAEPVYFQKKKTSPSSRSGGGRDGNRRSGGGNRDNKFGDKNNRSNKGGAAGGRSDNFKKKEGRFNKGRRSA